MHHVHEHLGVVSVEPILLSSFHLPTLSLPTCRAPTDLLYLIFSDPLPLQPEQILSTSVGERFLLAFRSIAKFLIVLFPKESTLEDIRGQD